jgi:hypothetical protein
MRRSSIRSSTQTLPTRKPVCAICHGVEAGRQAQKSPVILRAFRELFTYGLKWRHEEKLYSVKYWQEKMTRVLFFTLLCCMLLSLGPKLHIAGYSTLTLPEYFLNKLPIINQLLPDRLTVYVFFVTSLQPVFSRLDIIPVNTEGIIIYKINNR